MAKFRSFVILAGMRTGSNFLQSNLEALDGVACVGEAFNPSFIGGPKRTELLGITRAQRDADPLRLLAKMREAPELTGFRYFHDHDPRVFSAVMGDRDCAKIILTRNPLESYVSLGIARVTNQWRVTNVKAAKRARMQFDLAEFSAHLEQIHAFQARIRHGLQDHGQTGFYLTYDDINRLETLSGLAEWLGVPEGPSNVVGKLKRQNSVALDEKVTNYEEMVEALALLDLAGAQVLSSVEPQRGPVVPTYAIAAKSPLIFQPVKGGPVPAVLNWLSAMDDEPALRDHTRASLRKWQRAHPHHRAFTVLRHPLARAHVTFCEKILPASEGAYVKLRGVLRDVHSVPLPEGEPGPDYDHGAAFRAFLQFLIDNLDGRSNIRVDPFWASQSAIIAGFGGLRAPDVLIRESEMRTALPALAQSLGLSAPPVPIETDPHAGKLAAIYSNDLDRLCRKAYRRDYEGFGFGNWAPNSV